MLSMADGQVAAVPVVESGEPLVDASAVVRVADRRGLGDGRYGRVRRGIRDRLARAQEALPDGINLLLIEGHRTVAEQQRLLAVTTDQIRRNQSDQDASAVAQAVAAAVARYVAPLEVAGHVAGAAVDITLCDDAGHELDLGSPEAAGEQDSGGRCWFDAEVSPAARERRDLLATVLTAQGFVNYPAEWWHWSHGDRYWAAVTGADHAPYGPAPAMFDHEVDASTVALAARCDNRGRWGPDDRRGTLNLITAEVRVAAAVLVRTGRIVSLARPIDTAPSAVNVRPAWHVMHLETERPYAAADSLHLQIHGLAVTHLDALGHMYLDGVGYNGVRQDDAVDMAGLRALDITAMADGIVTRGVLLDVAAAGGERWLEPGRYVDAALLEAAERHAGVTVRPGDAVVVHVGLERRELQRGPEDPARRAGLGLDAVAWLHERGVAVYTGDCIERFPETGSFAPMPLHQIGIARMGLALLDAPSLTALLEAVAAEGRSEFLFTATPLVIPGGTGSPVNPLALF